MSSIVIVDYGVGNVRSVQKAFIRCRVHATISRDLTAISKADAIVLPGVGAFGVAMTKLREAGLVEVLRRVAIEERKPFLGICLGMQLMADASSEGGQCEGLGIVGGRVERLELGAEYDRFGRKVSLPHIGWNSVSPRSSARLFRGIAAETDFYFVHSYHVVCDDQADVAASSEYGQTFTCALEKGNLLGVQFHPEKSQRAGLTLVENFIDVTRQRAAA